MKKQTLILIVFAFVFTGCAKLEGPTQPAKVMDSVPPPPATPENPDSPTAPESPTPPDNDKNSGLQVCYLQTSKGQTCFEVHNRDDVNDAEPKYNYVDSFNDPSFPSGLDRWQYRSPLNLLFSSQHVSNAPLAENFLRAEVLNANDNRGHYGFFSTEALHRIQQMREHFGKPLIINSGYRSPSYNTSLPGAAKYSRHTYGDAIDFKVPGVSFQTIADKCIDLGAGYYQIYSTHIHCDWRTTPLNETIYGEDLRPSSIHKHSHGDVIHALTNELEIISSKQVQLSAKSNKAPIKLSAKNIWLEDGKGIIWFWQVSQNGKVVKTSHVSNPTFALPPGEYQVSVNIGGSLTKSITLTVR